LVFPDLYPDNVFDFQQIKLPAKLLEDFLYLDKVFDVEHIELPSLRVTMSYEVIEATSINDSHDEYESV